MQPVCRDRPVWVTPACKVRLVCKAKRVLGAAVSQVCKAKPDSRDKLVLEFRVRRV